MTVSLNALIKTPEGKVTTLNELDKQNLLSWECSEMTGKKRNGERKAVMRYHAVYLPTKTDNGADVWQITKTIYKYKTTGKFEIGY